MSDLAATQVMAVATAVRTGAIRMLQMIGGAPAPQAPIRSSRPHWAPAGTLAASATARI